MHLMLTTDHFARTAGDAGHYAAAAGIIALILLPVVFFLAALISILGSRQSGGMKLVWLVFAFCAPFLGPLLWFVIGRGQAERARL
jgi:uncharacterized RDD family membrane protein YckC